MSGGNIADWDCTAHYLGSVDRSDSDITGNILRFEQLSYIFSTPQYFATGYNIHDN